MRYDVETTVAAAVVAYLGAEMDPTLACVPGSLPATAPCLIVDFTDPMSIDQAHRIVVQSPSWKTSSSQPAVFIAAVNVIAKSRWTQPTLRADYAAHNARTNELRDKLTNPMLATALGLLMPEGMALDWRNPAMDCSMRIFDNGWITSESAFQVAGHFIASP